MKDNSAKNPNIIEIRDDPSVQQASGLVLSEGLRPRRVVLRHLENEGKYVTQVEYMRVDVETRRSETSRRLRDYVVCTHESFDLSRCFAYDRFGRPRIHGRTKEAALEAALRDFRQRAVVWWP